MAPAARHYVALTLLLGMASGCGQGAGRTTTTTSTPTTTGIPSTTSTQAGTSTSSIAPTTAVPAEVGDLLVVGDWGSGTLPQGAVAGAMARHAEDEEVAAILTTGDNFYSDDAAFLMDPFGWAIGAGIPFWITWGNHDVESPTRIEVVEETFEDPPRWTVHQWGRVDVVILDSTQIGNEEQARFLADTLAGEDDPTIVVFHVPPYSCGSHGGSEAVEETWIADLDDDVFLVLNGHEHNYQRFESGAVTFVVTGGGGASLTELASCPSGHPERITGETVHHFVVLEQADDVDARVVDVNGETVDQFVLGIP